MNNNHKKPSIFSFAMTPTIDLRFELVNQFKTIFSRTECKTNYAYNSE